MNGTRQHIDITLKISGIKEGLLLQLRDEFFHHTRRYYCHKLCLFLSLMYIIYYK